MGDALEPTRIGAARASRTSTIAAIGLMAAVLAIAGVALAEQTHHVEEGQSIQAAIDAAQPGDDILVEPATYEESIVVDKADLSIASAGVFADASIVSPADEATTVEIAAEGVELVGLQISSEGTGTLVEDVGLTTGIHVGSPGALIEDVTIELPGGWCGPNLDAPQAICSKPWITGVRAEAGVTVRDSEIRTTLASAEDQAALGAHGVNANTHHEVVIRETTVTGYGLGIVNWGPGLTVEDSQLVGNVRGVQIPTDDVILEGNRFAGNQIAVNVAGSKAQGPTNVELSGNDLGPSNAIALQIEQNNEESSIDATGNYWGVVTCAAIEQGRIVDEGTDNEVDVAGYYALPLFDQRAQVELDPSCSP